MFRWDDDEPFHHLGGHNVEDLTPRRAWYRVVLVHPQLGVACHCSSCLASTHGGLTNIRRCSASERRMCTSMTTLRHSAMLDLVFPSRRPPSSSSAASIIRAASAPPSALKQLPGHVAHRRPGSSGLRGILVSQATSALGWQLSARSTERALQASACGLCGLGRRPLQPCGEAALCPPSIHEG